MWFFFLLSAWYYSEPGVLCKLLKNHQRLWTTVCTHQPCCYHIWYHPLLLLNCTFLMDYCNSCCTSLLQTGDLERETHKRGRGLLLLSLFEIEECFGVVQSPVCFIQPRAAHTQLTHTHLDEDSDFPNLSTHTSLMGNNVWYMSSFLFPQCVIISRKDVFVIHLLKCVFDTHLLL